MSNIGSDILYKINDFITIYPYNPLSKVCSSWMHWMTARQYGDAYVDTISDALPCNIYMQYKYKFRNVIGVYDELMCSMQARLRHDTCDEEGRVGYNKDTVIGKTRYIAADSYMNDKHDRMVHIVGPYGGISYKRDNATIQYIFVCAGLYDYCNAATDLIMCDSYDFYTSLDDIPYGVPIEINAVEMFDKTFGIVRDVSRGLVESYLMQIMRDWDISTSDITNVGNHVRGIARLQTYDHPVFCNVLSRLPQRIAKFKHALINGLEDEFIEEMGALYKYVEPAVAFADYNPAASILRLTYNVFWRIMSFISPYEYAPIIATNPRFMYYEPKHRTIPTTVAVDAFISQRVIKFDELRDLIYTLQHSVYGLTPVIVCSGAVTKLCGYVVLVYTGDYVNIEALGKIDDLVFMCIGTTKQCAMAETCTTTINIAFDNWHMVSYTVDVQYGVPYKIKGLLQPMKYSKQRLGRARRRAAFAVLREHMPQYEMVDEKEDTVTLDRMAAYRLVDAVCSNRRVPDTYQTYSRRLVYVVEHMHEILAGADLTAQIDALRDDVKYMPGLVHYILHALCDAPTTARQTH